MKIVKFNDGTFGIRRWFFSYEYASVNNVDVWWNEGIDVSRYCRFNSKEHAHLMLARLTNTVESLGLGKGTPV